MLKSDRSKTQPKAVEELNFEEILNRKQAKLQELLPDIYNELNKSDPALVLLEISSYTEGLLRNRINQGLVSVMLDHARGIDLDNLGKLYGIRRKLIKEGDLESIPVIDSIWESDEELRDRIMEAPKGFSVAGPRAAYVYYGKLADNKVKNISALSFTPMEIEIIVLSYEGNGAPSSELLKKVYEKLSADDIRPMGDKLIVKPAEIIEYEIDIEIDFKNQRVFDKKTLLNSIYNALENYTKEEHDLGGFVSHAGIHACGFVEHVEDVRIKSPLHNIVCNETQATYCKKIIITEKI